VLGLDSFFPSTEKGFLFHGFKFYQIVLSWLLHDYTPSEKVLFTKLGEQTE